METTVTGIFASEEEARHATERLVAAGFGIDQISIVMADTPHRHELVREETTDKARGAVAGAAVGGAFAAILAGALALPVLGLFAAGPLLAVLTAGPVGAAAGGLAGFLVDAADDSEIEHEYETLLDQGGVLLGVHTGRARAAEARSLLVAAGGRAISDAVHRAHRVDTDD